MIIFKHPADISSYIRLQQLKSRRVAFVPTMGALHSGHITLVQNAKKGSDLVVCSIFVNPTQFNDATDFEKYPTTIEQDICQLVKAGCDLLLLPPVKDIYPDGAKPGRHYELGELETILEGKYRPGHFQGVCQVVHRLLEIVDPEKLYLGQKDFQQCMVLKKMVDLLHLKTDIVVSPTMREADGLAMSSRNLRLNEAERRKAPVIYRTLNTIRENLQPGNLELLKANAMECLVNEGFRPDYVEIASKDTLAIIHEWDGATPLVALAAAYLNQVRLIDNIPLQ